MKLVAVLSALGMSACAMAGIRTEAVEYTHGEVVLKGYIAYDDATDAKRPGVLVAHEWWGCNEYAKGRAQKLAELGYVAFALDMYGKGKVTDKADQAGQWAGAFMADRKLMRERALAGLAVLTAHPLADASRIAAIGYCFGGTVALELARTGADVKAVVPFHAGKLATPSPADDAKIRGKVLVCNGAEDGFLTAEERAAFLRGMREAKVDFQFIDYAGAVHAFTNPGAGAYGIPGVEYQEAADRRSWGHMKMLFAEVFGGAAEHAPEKTAAEKPAEGEAAPAERLMMDR